MPAVKSLEQLNHIRENVLQKKRRQAASHSIQILVAMGTCGIALGARATLKSLLNYIETEKVSGVTITETGCLGLCEQEPTLQVIVANQPIVMYGKVDPQVAQKIMRQHIQNGKPVQEHIISI